MRTRIYIAAAAAVAAVLAAFPALASAGRMR